MDVMAFIQAGLKGNNESKNFGLFVRQRREELGLSVRGMAAELDMTPTYLSDIEKGNRSAPTKYLDKIRIVLKIPQEQTNPFCDLAFSSRGHQHEDINPYLGEHPVARVALRRARDLNLSDDQWEAIIRQMESQVTKVTVNQEAHGSKVWKNDSKMDKASITASVIEDK